MYLRASTCLPKQLCTLTYLFSWYIKLRESRLLSRIFIEERNRRTQGESELIVYECTQKQDSLDSFVHGEWMQEKVFYTYIFFSLVQLLWCMNEPYLFEISLWWKLMLLKNWLTESESEKLMHCLQYNMILSFSLWNDIVCCCEGSYIT